MGNSLRCCLACVLPFGALDLIRIVHLNGWVEEITRPITAGEVLDANPNHILSKPCAQGMVRRIMILSPESDLKRGSIYFLIPDASVPQTKKGRSGGHKARAPADDNKLKLSSSSMNLNRDNQVTINSDDVVVFEKKSSRRARRKSGQVSEGWQPYLQSISEE